MKIGNKVLSLYRQNNKFEIIVCGHSQKDKLNI